MVPFPGLVFLEELMVVKCEPFTGQGKEGSPHYPWEVAASPRRRTPCLMSGNVVTEDSQQD